mgnify:CR=1 FL=1
MRGKKFSLHPFSAAGTDANEVTIFISKERINYAAPSKKVANAPEGVLSDST